ncbi:MAG: hypothetical protein ACJ731_07325 [Vicinamibacterales bacterium]
MPRRCCTSNARVLFGAPLQRHVIERSRFFKQVRDPDGRLETRSQKRAALAFQQQSGRLRHPK